MLKTKNLSVGYKNHIVVDNLNLNIKSGTITCLVGPNGSGKSTIIKTISSQIQPIDGNVSILDQDIQTLNSKELATKLSSLYTDHIHTRLLTGREIIETGRYPYTDLLGRLDNKDKEIIKESARLVGGTDLLDRYYDQMSDGERQRILLARAIAQQTDIIVLDEPVSHLDIRYKIDILNTLKLMAEDYDKAIILSLHELDLVPQIADQVVLLTESGPKIGRPADILTIENITETYGIDESSYDPLTGKISL